VLRALSLCACRRHTVFPFPNQRKEPLTDAQHVRTAVAQFDQVTDLSDEDRALAFANTSRRRPNTMTSSFRRRSWRDLGVHPQPHRKEAAAKTVKTKRERGELKDAGAKAAATRKREERGG
jgi:hypothetical protein